MPAGRRIIVGARSVPPYSLTWIGRLAAFLTLSVAAVSVVAVPSEPAGARFVGWRQLRTEHFTIIFEPRDEAHAQEVAGFAEDRYRQITAFFGSFPRRIPVVLRGRVDVENGLTTPLPPSITLHIGAPHGRSFGVRGSRWLELVFVHELSHFVHLSMQSGLWQWLSLGLGSTGPWAAGMGLPAWLIEGAAVYAETAFTDAGRGRNEFFAILSKAPILEGEWFDRWRAGHSSAFPPRGRHYVAGYLLVEHLQRRFGEQTLVQIMEDYLRFPFFGPWAAIRRVTGHSYRDLWDDLEKELRRRYEGQGELVGAHAGPVGEDVARTSQAAESRVRALVGSAASAPPQLYLGAATTEGILAYRTSLTRPPDLVRLTAESAPDGTRRTKVQHLAPLRLADPYSLTATGDGAIVVYAAIRIRRDRPSGSEITSDLYRLDTLSGARRQLTAGAHLWHPAVSTDGQVLVAVQGVGPHSRLVRVDQQTGELHELVAVEASVILHPTLRADGAVVVFELSTGRDHDLYALPIDVATRSPPLGRPMRSFNDTHMVRVTGPGRSGEFFPTFSASGESLLFGSDRGGALALYRIDAPGRPWHAVVSDPVGAFAGVEVGGDLYYAAYTAAGDTIRRLPLTQTRPTSVSATMIAVPDLRDMVAESVASNPAVPIATRPHWDLPIPSLWLPIPSLLFTDNGIDLGFGAGVVATAVRATSQVVATAAYHPQLGQPVGSANLTVSAGRLRFRYTGALEYDISKGAHTRTARHSAEMRIALLDDVLHDRSTSRLTTVWGGIGHLRVRTAAAPLPLGDAQGTEIVVETVASLGVGTDWRRGGSPKDQFHPLAFSAAVALESPVHGWKPLLQGAVSAQVPAFPSHVARVQLHVATAAIGGDALPSVPVTDVRGGFDLGPAGQTRLVGAVDYLMSLALLDLPLLGFAKLGAMTAGLHIEAVADWDEQGTAQLGKRAFIGLELGAVLGAGSFSVPVGAGVALALPDAEVRPYVFLGFTPEPPLFRAGGLR